MGGNHVLVPCSLCNETLVRRGRLRCYKCYGAGPGIGTPEERFKAGYVIADSGCWEWQKARDKYGYGSIRGYGQKLAHRLSWVIHFGSIPPATPDVLHHCDNPSCVNPGHLFLGTQADNNRDRDAKGRGRIGRKYRGEDHYQAKLTNEQALFILRSDVPAKELASQFGIHPTHVNRIRRGKKWAHLQGEVAA